RVQPNGLAFSPDESLLYVADTGRSHEPDCEPTITAYPVSADGRTLGAGTTICTCDTGMFDGFRIDTAGRIWSSAADGVHCFSPEGKLLGKIFTDEVVANLVFGGPKRNRLFICATTSLRSIYVNAQGCSYFPQA
ncbi:MAG: SMP-30/gluconolactonase/LRE family protein, partial [Deltaproteobacteria bacterium]